MNNVRIALPEIVVPGRRLGRSINHDIRSAQYLVAETSNPASASWDSRIGILDQGNLGSCTANATVGELGTEPFYDTLPEGAVLDEAKAVVLYEAATRLDPFPGQYKPTDTGSDTLSAAKAAKNAGLASGYVHAVSLAGLHTMIAGGPFTIGIPWYSDMDNPDSNGLVKVGGTVRGGHALCVVAYDSSSNLWKIRNSWGDGWAKGGYCFWSDDDMARLLSEQGDATQLVARDKPAPIPTPASTTVTFSPAQHDALDAWADNRWGRGAKAAREAWNGAKGL